MNQSPILKFNEEQNLFHDKFLDVVGAGFNFNHEKGLAEWLKNSVDAYRRVRESDKDQYITFRFTDGNKDNPPIIECFDFVGMEFVDIEMAFKWWGDPNAASRGKFKVYGGHGNGGKFYMRQMFQQSYFITYKSGKINIFGFNENRKYGFAEDYKDKKVSLDEALKIAGIDKSLIPNSILHKLERNETGFTVVKGVRPKKIVGNSLPVNRICEKLKYHPQARSPLKYCNVSVIHNNKILTSNLRMEEIEPMMGFELPSVFEIPEFVDSVEDDGNKVKMSDEKYNAGKLILKTSSQPFGRGGKKQELNCIDIVGEIGVIASYTMEQLPALRYFPQAQYIYGECQCPILEHPEYDCVQNDREKLVSNDRTNALLKWISGRIDEVACKIAEKDAEKEEEKNIRATDEFNQILNKWKNQFMSKLFAEVLGGPGKGTSTGGQGDDGSGGGTDKDSDSKGGLGSGAGKGGGEGEEKKKGMRAPMVLLSGQEDPECPGIPVTFSDRHFAVEQRQQDVDRGLYWINLEKPMAKKLVDKYGVDSPRWRNYLFQRYVDIFTKETIYRLAKKEGGSLTAEQVDYEIMRVASLVYDKATVDLEDFLLNDKYKKSSDETTETQ